jgi:hypothetical protein
MSQGIYSNDKMSWWFAREGKLPDVPKQVELVLSDLCNEWNEAKSATRS